MSFYSFEFSWIKRRKVRKAVQREIQRLQKQTVNLYGDYLTTIDSKEKESSVFQYEEIIKQIEQRAGFLVITRDIS